MASKSTKFSRKIGKVCRGHRRRRPQPTDPLGFETLESRQLLAAVTVGNTLDVVNGDTSSIASLIASDGGDGISLREAIDAANNTAGADTVTFDGGVFTGGAASVIRLGGTELVISESLTIDGSTGTNVAITADTSGNDTLVAGTFITDVAASYSAGTLADNTSRIFRVVAPGGNVVRFTGLTLTGGDAIRSGGAISNDFANLVIEDSSVSGNRSLRGGTGFAADGGGIYTNGGAVTLTDSTVSGNQSEDVGGGIYTRTGAAMLTNSIVSGNRSGSPFYGGGGIGARATSVTLIGSTVSGNSTPGDGGGINTVNGWLALTNSTVSGNQSGNGGGINTGHATLTLTGSTVSGNSSANRGGGIHTQVGAVTLNNSTVSGNQSAGFGGGIYTRLGALALTNSTVSYNIAAADGGGIFSGVSSVTIANSTISQNDSGGAGGGLFAPNIHLDPALTISNSIFAYNVNGAAAPDLQFDPDGAIAIDFSLISHTNGSGITSTTGTGNLLDVPVMLGPLADNGGPTFTHALLPGSLAIDAGNSTLPTDQRGATRPFDLPSRPNASGGNATDMGAVEQQGPGLIVNTDQDVVDPMDTGNSLREAINFANLNPGPDTITFDANVFSSQQTIDLGSELPTITDDVTITGPGADLLTLNGGGGTDGLIGNGDGFRLLNIDDGIAANQIDVQISDLTFTGGDHTGIGGAILNAEDLTLTGSQLMVNHAQFGGGLFNTGIANVIGSTVARNKSTRNGGGIENSGTLTLTNSTVSGNTSSENGGGLINFGPSGSTASVTINNSTFTGNSAANNAANGIWNANVYSTGVVTANNSILTDSILNDGTLTGDFNLFGTGGATTGGASDITGVSDPLLGPLSDNGGTTLTHDLLLGSPALDAGNSTLTTDARGLVRPVDLRSVANATGGNGSDLGAVEAQAEQDSLIVTTTADVINPFDDETSLREAIAFANDPTTGNNSDGDADNDGNPNDTITFASGIGQAFETGGTIRLTQGEIEITAPVTIDGSSAPLVLITGDALGDDTTDVVGITDLSQTAAGELDDNNRIFNVTADVPVTLDSLTLTGGRTTADGHGEGGGAVRARGDLTLIGSTVSGNGTVGRDAEGGGIYVGENATLIHTTVSGNRTAGIRARGGGISVDDGLTLTNSTISGNSTLGDFSSGGGLFVFSGNATLTESTVSHNRTAGYRADGGGLYLRTYSSATLTNSTISGNSTAGDRAGGGGLFLSIYTSATLTNSTVSGNSTAGDRAVGGGLSIGYSSTTTLTNTIVLGNVTQFAGVVNDEIDGTVTFNGRNIVGANTAAFDASVDPNVINADPAVVFAAIAETLADTNADGVPDTPTGVFGGVLADNGGNVQTVALKSTATNPALDAGQDDQLDETVVGIDLNGDGDTLDVIDTDARGTGFARRVDLPVNANNGTNQIDLGAFEIEASAIEARSLVVTTTADVIDPLDGETSLREAIAFANDPTAGNNSDGDADNDGSPNDTITFASAGGQAFVVGGTIRLTEGEIEITTPVTIDGSMSPLVLITGDARGDDTTDPVGITDLSQTAAGELGDNTRIFNIAATVPVTLDSLILTGGRTTGIGEKGGGVRSAGDLTTIRSTISGNSTAGANAYGGGLFVDGNATLTHSTVSGNVTTGNNAPGAGLASYTGNATLFASTVSGNSTAGNTSDGGGLFIWYGNATLTNSTISGNSTAGYRSNGAGLYVLSGDATLTGSTVVGNSTAGDDADGGGLFILLGDATLTNSIVLGNVTAGAGVGDDEISGTFTFNGHNLVGANTTAFNATVDPNVDNADPAAVFAAITETLADTNADGIPDAPTGAFGGVLADNGGNVQTVALKSTITNPALDAGLDSQLDETVVGIDLNGDGDILDVIDTDARGTGFARLIDLPFANNNGTNQVDLGAFEASNLPPEFTSSATADVAENTQAVHTLTATDPDLPAQTITFSIVGSGEDNQFFEVVGDLLQFVVAPDFESPADANGDNTYEVSVEADDGEGGFATQTILINVTPTNDNLPIFTSPATAEVPENTQVVHTLTATDADLPAQTITFSVGGYGTDNDFFEVVGDQLQFIAAPDFEANRNNLYDVTIQADDGNGGVTTQQVLVTVNPINDNLPVFTSPTTASVAENTQVVHTLTATDDDLPVQTITFSVGGNGADNSFFDVLGDQLRFIALPDFENPTDADGDNVYEVSVEADDGEGGVRAQTILVTVTNLAEPMTFVVDITTDEHDGDFSAGDLSLREAIARANNNLGADTIMFATGSGQAFENGGLIRLTQGELVIADEVTIDGSAPAAITVTGDASGDDTLTIDPLGNAITDAINNTNSGDNSRVFQVTAGSSTLDRLVITGGFAVEGGGIRVDSGASLTLHASSLSGNQTSGFGGGLRNRGTVVVSGTTVYGNRGILGGGISNRGSSSTATLTVVDTTISGNQAQEGGGGISSSVGDVLTVVSSTIANNRADGEFVVGGGIVSSGETNIVNTTITGNLATGTFITLGGGLAVDSGTTTLANSIILGNQGITSTTPELFVSATGASLVQSGGNLIGDTFSINGTTQQTGISAADVFAATTNNSGVDAGVLAANGGSVQTVALRQDVANSALDGGQDDRLDESIVGLDLNGDGDMDDVISTDARGLNRLVDLSSVANNGVNSSDLGAFELQQITPSCDFDADFDCDIDDIDAMVMEIAAGTNNGAFDLTGDGSVDLADRDQWLGDAGALNLVSGNAYLVGDANLDGVVDGQDFILWNNNKFQTTGKWSQGDFDADGTTDGRDFLIWNANKFQSSDAGSAALAKGDAPKDEKTDHELNRRSIIIDGLFAELVRI